MMTNTMTSITRTMTTMMPTSAKSRRKIRGVQRSNSEFLNRPLDTKNFITRRPRKTSRHHRSQRSELENRIPKPTSGHQELVGDPRARRERTKSRSKNTRRHTYSAARTKTMQNQCFPRAPYILAIRRSHQKIGSVQRLN